MSSSQYNTCSALQRSNKGGQPWNPVQTPLTQRVGQLVTIQSEKETHDPCAQTLLLTGARAVQQSATGSRQCYSLQCSLVHGSAGYFLLPLQNKTDEPEGQGHRTVKTNKKQTNSRTSQPPKIRAGREDVTVARCVFTDGAGSTLHSLVTSVG